MADEKLLMTPGPTMIPTRVLEVMRRQIIHHRTDNFEKGFDELCEGLKQVFQTKNTVMTFSGSGSGAMESAVVNMFSPGDSVLAVSVGAFGDRFAQIAAAFGLNVKKIEVPWGCAFDPNAIEEALNADKAGEIKGVLLTHNETSTGVTNDIKAVGEIMKGGDRVLIVDTVSSLGALEVKTDEWGLDVVITCSQKGLMNAPGLAFAAVSDKGWAAYERAKLPKFYWDYKKYKDGIFRLSENPPYTPAISLVLAQNEALKMIFEEGLDEVFKRHERLALATQAGVAALGLSLFPEQKVSSHVITAVLPPEGVKIGDVIKDMNVSYDVMAVGGQKNLKGKLLRIGHCGYCNEFDLIKAFTALELSLEKAGYKFESGASLAAVKKIFVDYWFN